MNVPNWRAPHALSAETKAGRSSLPGLPFLADPKGTEFDPRDSARAADVRSHRLRDRPQEIRPGNRPLDIHVVRRGLAGREDERPELEGSTRLERGDEGRPVELTRAPVSGRSEIR